MRSVAKRELNQRTAEVLLDVEEHGPVLVTERGVARWRIEALSSEVGSKGGLRISRPARSRGGWKSYPRHQVAELSGTTLDELRDDRI